ncbi:DUF6789 family protein [Salinisphaera sp. SPP-AMP-43]|uniref:DUF6789 family protein n=1 Tax=Salinisphaera sp. SPP-AMP-43 TaxID=3121288 RepID=UPI003C6E0F81
MAPGKAVAAGFMASMVLAGCMLGQTLAQVWPDLDWIELIQRLTGEPRALGWLGHFVIGSLIWGLGFAALYRLLPGHNGLLKGLAFGVLAWVGMMLLFFPVAGGGFFGVAIGWPATLATFGAHLLYGGVLGMCYGAPDR